MFLGTRVLTISASHLFRRTKGNNSTIMCLLRSFLQPKVLTTAVGSSPKPHKDIFGHVTRIGMNCLTLNLFLQSLNVV
jgi:hypothetical protein